MGPTIPVTNSECPKSCSMFVHFDSYQADFEGSKSVTIVEAATYHSFNFVLALTIIIRRTGPLD